MSLTRKNLSTLWNEASVPTLSRWELEIIVPSKRKISSLANFFCSNGLIVSSDWIESGSGSPPSILNTKEFSEDDFDGMCEQTFLTLSQSIKNLIYYKVTSNFFSPAIRYGDYVAGTKIQKEDILNLNSLAFIVHENTVHVGFLEYTDKVLLKNSHGKKIEFIDYTFLAKIHWTAMRP